MSDWARATAYRNRQAAGDVAIPGHVLPAGASLRDVEALFRTRPELSSVVVLGAEPSEPRARDVPLSPPRPRLLSRRAFEAQITGRLGYGRALSVQRRLGDFCQARTVVVSEDEALTTVVAAVLARPDAEQPDDVVVVGRNGSIGIAQASTVFARVADEYSQQATHDPLTALGNRSMLATAAQEVLLADAEAGRRTGLLVLDLDRFKDVNDALGHDAGDQVLCHVSDALRGSSLAARGLIARLGGDEFAVLLPGLETRQQDRDEDLGAPLVNRLRAAAEEALRVIAGPFAVSGSIVTVEGSIGGAWSPEHGVDLATMLHHAGSAMYRAKRERTRVEISSTTTTGVTPRELTLLTELNTAVPSGQLRLHYQPVVDAATGVVVGAEALVRWQHPRRGLLPPGVFLPAAERSEVIHNLTDWVMAAAITQAAAWADVGRPLPVAVNLSPRLLVHGDLSARVKRLLDTHGLAPHLLTLEVTESAVMTQPELAAARLASLRALGIRLALDDFGTGFTSLSMLTQMDFDELKVDRVFIAKALTDNASAAIVHSVLELGHRLGLEVVAEGVEDEPTAELLRRLGYDRLQGYLFGRPGPLAESDALCRRAELS